MRISMLVFAMSAAPALAQTVNVAQVEGRNFRISGTGARGGSVSVSGAASGTIAADAKGNYSGVLAAPTLGSITVKDGAGVVGTASLADAAPAVKGFTVTRVAAVDPATGKPYLAGYTFSGTVAHAAPKGLMVVLGGPVRVNANVASVAADGTWSVFVAVQDPNPAGTPIPVGTQVSATVVDWYGQKGSSAAAVP